jgi:uncharacterized protein YprB with RNaseH-like and TPR domain
MDIEDKLKGLRKERRVRSRVQKVREAWDRIEGEEGLSVKEKLERLINLTGTSGTGKKTTPRTDAPVLPRESVRLLENSYRLDVRYGQIPVSLGLDIPGKILAFLSRDAAFEELDLSTAVFVDLETTGLAGGTGTLPFLVGLGFYSGDRFRVVQFFLGEMAEEGRMIEEMEGLFREMAFRSVVTYNGKVFDLPILETRFALQRKRFPLVDLPHLDFLFSARSLWKHKHESCRLFTLAQEIVQAERAEDIPSAEIPTRYFQFIRTGDFSLVEPILYHNEEDLLSLLGVVIAGAALVDGNGEFAERGGADAMDLFGVARLFERAGDVSKSASLLEKALEGRLTGEVMTSARKKLSAHFKRNRDWDKAVSLWRRTGDEADELFCLRELAMYYEHKMKDFEEAVKAAEEGLAVSLGKSPFYQSDFEKRLARLKSKTERSKRRDRK